MDIRIGNYFKPKHEIAITLFLLAFLTLAPKLSLCQEEEGNEEESRFKHRLTAMMANTHIPSADEVNGQNTIFIAPTWGINYDYWFSEKFALGVHTDIILQKFEVETREDDVEIERSFPVAVCAVGIYRPFEKWSFVFGGGQEFEKNESFAMYCLGVEYGIELPKEWELSFNFIYDNKINAYDTWMFGIGFSKLLGF